MYISIYIYVHLIGIWQKKQSRWVVCTWGIFPGGLERAIWRTCLIDTEKFSASTWRTGLVRSFYFLHPFVPNRTIEFLFFRPVNPSECGFYCFFLFTSRACVWSTWKDSVLMCRISSLLHDLSILYQYYCGETVIVMSLSFKERCCCISFSFSCGWG